MSNPAGFTGIIWLIAAMIVVALGITLVCGTLLHWVPIIGSIIVGYMAVNSINK